MPIQPIGEKNRKGNLDSYYSIKDYTAINPEFGNLDDFKTLVDEIHAQGMHVIIDWVANHTAWDHPWVETNPEYYKKNPEGNFSSPHGHDWDDVISLDYSNIELRDKMQKALEYWISETDIDGYRCDVAGMVPVDFWNYSRPKLDKIKPIFMLGEWESRDLHEHAFDMTYGWGLYNVMENIAHGKYNAMKLRHHYADELNSFPKDAIKIREWTIKGLFCQWMLLVCRGYLRKC